MGTYKRKEGENYINKRLKELEKQGISADSVLKGKDIKTYAYSEKGLNQFKKQVKRAKELPSIIADNEAYDIKVGRKKEPNENLSTKIKDKVFSILGKAKNKVRKNYISPQTKRIMKFNYDDIEPNKNNIKQITSDVSNTFFDRYFKNYTNEYEIKKRVDDIKNRFGNRLDFIYDFIDDVESLDFKYEIDGVVFTKDEFKNDFESVYDDNMLQRLEKMEQLLTSKKYRL